MATASPASRAWRAATRNAAASGTTTPAVRAAEEDGDVVGALVGDEQVGDAVAVDVLDGQPAGLGADGVAQRFLEGGPAGPVEAGAAVDQHAVAAAAQDDGVEEGRVRAAELDQ